MVRVQAGVASWRDWVQQTMARGAGKANEWISGLVHEESHGESTDKPVCHGNPDARNEGLAQVVNQWQ
eukprot:4309563-Amphidinium_carterae.1